MSLTHIFFIFRKEIIRWLVVIVALYACFALVIWSFSSSLVVFLKQQPELIPDTIEYIKLESLAIPLRVIADAILIALIVLSARKRIYAFLILRLVVSTASDYIFISNSALGLSWGGIGIAYSTIVINFILAIAGCVILLNRLAVRHSSVAPPSTVSSPTGKKWIKVSMFSGLESGIKNLAFVIMILKLINEIGEQGTLWVTNAFIWGWLLLPILTLGTLVKQDVGINCGVIGKRITGYLLLTIAVASVWVAAIPLWNTFVWNVMGVSNSGNIVSLALVFLPFYVVFAVNNVFDSYVYGMGRTDLMLYQSLLINGGYYVIAFMLYQNGIFIPTLHSISLLFGFGIALDCVATLFLFWLVEFPVRSHNEEKPRT